MLVWHHALNNDFRVTPVGGEDAKICFQRHTLVGASRTYAYLGKEFTASEWLRAIREGHTFFTTGPMAEFTVNQQIPGASVRLPPTGGMVTLEGRAWSYMPLRRMLIYHNGKVWKEIPFAGDRLSGEFREQIKVEEERLVFTWLVEGPAASSGGDAGSQQAGTNAIRVYVGDQKIRNRASAEYFITWIDKLRKMAEAWPGWRSQAEKDKVFAQFEQAKAVYAARASEAGR